MARDLHILPEDCVFAFCPAYEPADEPQSIRIVFDSMPGFITTALVALTLDDAERLSTRLNARLDLDRDAWWAVVACSMGGAGDGRRPRSPSTRPRASRNACLRRHPGCPGHPRAGQREGADRRGGAFRIRWRPPRAGGYPSGSTKAKQRVQDGDAR